MRFFDYLAMAATDFSKSGFFKKEDVVFLSSFRLMPNYN
jgi:hypothetical protein